METKLILTCLVLSLFSSKSPANPTRVLELSESDIGVIRTAVGFSTVLQFDSRPVSVVVGDQDSFKVEYLGNSITIKPVVPGTRTNMFVYTGYDRFSFRVIAGRTDAADYLVEIKEKAAKNEKRQADFNTVLAGERDSLPSTNTLGSAMTKRMVGKTALCNGVSLHLNSVSKPIGKPWLLLSFSLSSTKEMDFKGNDVFLKRAGIQVDFETLYLEGDKLLSDGTELHGSFLLSHKKTSLLEGLFLHFSPQSLANFKCQLKVSIPTDVPKKEDTREKSD